METNYDVNYFIKKFEAIPEESIGQGTIFNKCAYWHCDNDCCYLGDVAQAFTVLFSLSIKINPSAINDGYISDYQQPTPKQRILAALYDIKKMQDPKPIVPPREERIKIKYVSIDAEVKELITDKCLS